MVGNILRECIVFLCFSYLFHYISENRIIYLCITDDVSTDTERQPDQQLKFVGTGIFHVRGQISHHSCNVRFGYEHGNSSPERLFNVGGRFPEVDW